MSLGRLQIRKWFFFRMSQTPMWYGLESCGLLRMLSYEYKGNHSHDFIDHEKWHLSDGINRYGKQRVKREKVQALRCRYWSVDVSKKVWRKSLRWCLLDFELFLRIWHMAYPYSLHVKRRSHSINIRGNTNDCLEYLCGNKISFGFE